MRDRVFIVADDLTGALDSAATFAMRGASVRVACRPEAVLLTLVPIGEG